MRIMECQENYNKIEIIVVAELKSLAKRTILNDKDFWYYGSSHWSKKEKLSRMKIRARRIEGSKRLLEAFRLLGLGS